VVFLYLPKRLRLNKKDRNDHLHFKPPVLDAPLLYYIKKVFPCNGMIK
jgi:hypothetical protein